MSQTLEQRIQRIEDIEEIRRLRMQYHVNTNENRFDEMWKLFTEDAWVDFGYLAKARGRDEIKELFHKIPRSLSFVKQFIHNHLVDVDGDKATGISYLDARYAKDGESVMVAAGFKEKYVRTPEGWRIEEMLLDLYFSVPVQVGWAGEQMNYVKPFT